MVFVMDTVPCFHFKKMKINLTYYISCMKYAKLNRRDEQVYNRK